MLKSLIGNFYLRYFGANNRLERIWKIAQVDFKKRYYNDKFGLLWALINPLTQIALYYFVFTKILQRGQDNFALFLFSGIIMWLAFSNATTSAQRVLLDKIYLINNIQFKWLDLFSSHMISVTFGLIFNIVAYLFTLLLLGSSLGEHFYLFPIVLISWFLVTSGVCIILSLVKPIFEDISHIWAIVLMVGLWISGVFFDGTFYLENYVWFSHVNPFVGIILNTRACLLEGHSINMPLLIENLIYGIGLYLIATLLFKKYSKKIIEQL